MKPHNRAIAYTPLIPDDTHRDLPSFDTGPAERASRIPLAISTGTSTIENRSSISMAPTVAKNRGGDHHRLNAELIARTGSRVDQATVEQLKKRIQLLERWKERGYDGKR